MKAYKEIYSARWQTTKTSLHQYAKLLGKLKQNFAPEQKQFWHYGLYTGIRGITTQPLLAGDEVLSMMLDLHRHCFKLTLVDGREATFELANQTIHNISNQTLNQLVSWGIPCKIDETLFSSREPLEYDKASANNYWQSLSRINVILQEVKAEMQEETSSIQIFPHHFDLSLTWFSGRLARAVSKDEAVDAVEQIGLGFSPGDEDIKQAYFYVTAYPLPSKWLEAKLPKEAHWQSKPWEGGVLSYEQLLKADNPDHLLRDFYLSAWQSARSLMLD